MKLYLSSNGIPSSKELTKILKKGSRRSVAIIPNAWDNYPAERRRLNIESIQETFRAIDITPKLVDISITTGDELKNELTKHSLVWFMGGNSFYLNWLVHQSGIPEFLPSLIEHGVVYGGESAGAVLACPTLHGVELLDDPSEAPEVIWEGLDLVDFGIVPHWGLDKYAEKIQNCRDEMNKFVTVKTLTDSQALVIIDGETKLIDSSMK